MSKKKKERLRVQLIVSTNMGQILVAINGKHYEYWLDAALIPRIEYLLYNHRNKEALDLIKQKARRYEKV